MVDSVSLTALLISLVALLATVGQLLQQYYATADGLRRCQPSVMGLWARRTKLRFRWTEFRFETIFVTPRIIYGPIRIQDAEAEYTKPGTSKVFCDLVDTPGSLSASMTLPGWGSREARKYYDSDELVCWVPLLAQLHKQGRDAVQYFPQSPDSVANDTMIPTIQFIQKSWDFMPPDVTRPLASSTVCDVAIMARRLGMVWKSFDPGAGLMRAEGNGHVFTSTLVRSIGTILQYSYTSRDNSGNCFYIPAKEADKLGFGLVEFDHRLFGPLMKFDLDVGSFKEIAQSLPRLMRYRTSSQRDITETVHIIGKNIKAGMDFIPGLNDLIPLCSAMLISETVPRAPHVWLNRIPSPNRWARGLTGCREGRYIFAKRLLDFVERRAHRESRLPVRILSLLTELRGMRGSGWNDETTEIWEPRVTEAEISCRALLLTYHTEMTTFLQGSNVIYSVLVSEHIVQASAISPDLSPDFRNEYDLENADPYLMWSMEVCFNVLPALVERVIRTHMVFFDKPNLTKIEVENAWLAMMFRAICWQMAHVMIPGVPPLPSEHWNSKMPVYIG
ncbi:hypothetical protein B7463_g1989, partial [Scytalidium lignicola]